MLKIDQFWCEIDKKKKDVKVFQCYNEYQNDNSELMVSGKSSEIWWLLLKLL